MNSSRLKFGAIPFKASKLKFGCLGLILATFLMEILLRIFGVSYTNFYRPDPDLGMSLKPGATGWYAIEGKTFVTINSHGMRDREHSIEKPANTIRIAILGDSFAEALQVNLEQTFWAILESELQQCLEPFGKRVEVINFAVSGYGGAQELITLRNRVWEYSPDIVLLMFYPGNDVSDNLRSLRLDDNVPYFIEVNGKLVLDDSFRNSWSFRLRKSIWGKAAMFLVDHCRMLQLLNRARFVLKYSIKDRIHQSDKDLHREDFVYQKPRSPQWENAWKITENILSEMSREIQQNNRKFVVAIATDRNPVHPDEKIRRQFLTDLQIQNFDYPYHRLESLGKKNNFDVFPLLSAFQKYATDTGTHLHEPNHWNAAGHALAGKLLADHLCSQLK